MQFEKRNGAGSTNSGQADGSEVLGEARLRFTLGRIVATPGAIQALEAAGTTAWGLLHRHQTGDWGEVGDADKAENELSLKEGFRLLSAYRLPRTGEKIWIITEADRSATTLLLPDEY